MPELNIPFPGFYHSWLSQALDYEEEMTTENMAESEYYEGAWPEPLRMTASEIGEELFMAVSYPVAHEAMAEAYLDAFDNAAGVALGETRTLWFMDWRKGHKVRCKADTCGFKFSIMTSPREYNFTTDRLFATASMAFVKRLWKRSKADNHAALRKVIAERFTSRSGFISHYPNRLGDWPTDLADWDYNQLGTLLIACLSLTDFDEDSVVMAVLESDATSEALSEALDHDDLDARLMPKRIEKLTAWAEDDPAAVAKWKDDNPEQWAKLLAEDESEVLSLDLPGLPYRCKVTPDLLAE